MAIYHLTSKIIGRNSGRSVVAAAAYRSASCLTNEYDGVTHDYTKKNWVTHSEIILSAHAPPEYSNRSVLWNAVEKQENSSTCQLAREIEIALPKELSHDEHLNLIREFVGNNFTSHEICADFAIHNPPLRNDRNQPCDQDGNIVKDSSQMIFPNPHCHILLTMRPINAEGNFESKSQIEYICKRNEEELTFTASEFKQAKLDGWQKQYQYRDGKQKVWLTQEEGTLQNLSRISKTPRTTPYGRKNPTMEYLNSKEALMKWRQNWEDIVNEKFKSLDMNTQIDCRSFSDQGRTEELPTVHMGVEATNIERRADRLSHEGVPEHLIQRSYIGEINRDIREHNQIIQKLKESLLEAYKRTKDTLKSLAQKLELLRAQIIGYKYQHEFLRQRKIYYKSLLLTEYEKLQNNEHTESELQNYQQNYASYEKLKSNIAKLESKTNDLSSQYTKEKETIANEDLPQVQNYRSKLRQQLEDSVRKKLENHYGKAFNESLFKKAIQKTNHQLQIQDETKKNKCNHSQQRDINDTR